MGTLNVKKYSNFHLSVGMLEVKKYMNGVCLWERSRLKIYTNVCGNARSSKYIILICLWERSKLKKYTNVCLSVGTLEVKNIYKCLWERSKLKYI